MHGGSKMTTRLTFDDGLPIPGRRSTDSGFGAMVRTNVPNMKIGQSFHIPANDPTLAAFRASDTPANAPSGPVVDGINIGWAARALQSTGYYPANDVGAAIRVRAVESDDARGAGIRVWRTEPKRTDAA